MSTTTPPWGGLAVLLLAGFVTIFDLFVVNVAIPGIQSGLDASFAQINLVIAGYELAFGVLLISGGRLGDRFGRRRLFVFGMAAFTLASALCGFATSAEELIAARLGQGLAAALLLPQVYASIRVNFDAEDSRRAFSLLGATLGLAAIAGQVLGGWLLHLDLFGWGWRNIFLINIPIGLLAIAAARHIPESRAPGRPGLDWPGVALVGTALGLLLGALIGGPGQGWPAWSLLALGASALLLTGFLRQQRWRQRRGQVPLLDMRLLARPRFALCALLVLLIYATSSSFFLCFSLLAQSGLGADPLLAGSVFAPCSAGFVLASLAAPALIRHWGDRALAGGAWFYCLALAWLTGQVWLAAEDLELTWLIAPLVAVGAGQGLIMTPLLNLALGFVEEARAGMASGLLSTLQQVGAALGVAIVGMAFGAGLAVDGAYTRAFVTGMLPNLGAATLAALLLSLPGYARGHEKAA